MPKLKTHKGAAARFKITGSGKIMRMKRHSSHLRRKKPKKVRALYDSRVPLAPSEHHRVRTLLPYS